MNPDLASYLRHRCFKLATLSTTAAGLAGLGLGAFAHGGRRPAA